VVEVRFQSKMPGEALESIAGEFFNALLDQQLREKVGQESEKIRNLILAHALSRVEFESVNEVQVPLE
jgi:His-Xaa-Ser system protein HxsD